MIQYRCIVADPPWAERGGGKIKRGADRHYALLDTPEIARVMLRAPCWRPDQTGCHLWLWVTNNFLPAGLAVMDALGFRYITNLAWVKTRLGNVQIGLGQYLRGAHELCLLGVRGETMLPAVRDVPSVVFDERTEHSRKPDSVFAAIERVSPGPRLEMFARAPRSGWDVWGNEVSDGARA